jgi:D-xylose reductase
MSEPKILSIPEQVEVDGRPFPLAYEPGDLGADGLRDWIVSNRDALLTQVREHGAVLFRGFNVESPEAFDEAVQALHLENMPYVGGAAVRTNVVADRVFTANESPPSEPIPFHHEMAQVPNPPSYLLFYCDTPAEEGGETPLILSHEVYKYMASAHPAFASRLEALGVRYTRIMPAEDDASSAIGRSWRSTFQVSTKEEAEAKMTGMGTTWEWMAGDELRTVTATVPGVREDVRSGKKMFFNSVVAAFKGWVDSRNDPTKAVSFGDGSAMDAAVLEDIAAWMHANRVAFKWQAGDVLLIDNWVAMHSRNTFTGRRRVLASIGRDPLPFPPASLDTPVVSPAEQSYATFANGDKMPHVGFGFWKVPKEATAETVLNALKVGYRHLDCACDYGNEKEVGDGISAAISAGIVTRDEIFVTSKLWNTYHHPEHVEMACRKSLEDLQLEYVDLYLIHFPISLKYVPIETRYPPEWIHDPSAPDARMELDPVPMKDTWGAMEGLKRAGLAKHIGVSNFAPALLTDVMSYAEIKPEVLQIELHPYLTQSNVLRLARERYGMVVTGFSPLGAGSYVCLGMATPGDSVMEEPVVRTIARKLGKTAAQVVLRWGVQRGTCIIPKTSSVHRMAQNLSVFDFALSDADMASISALNKQRRFNDPGVFCEGMGCFCPIYDDC